MQFQKDANTVKNLKLDVDGVFGVNTHRALLNSPILGRSYREQVKAKESIKGVLDTVKATSSKLMDNPLPDLDNTDAGSYEPPPPVSLGIKGADREPKIHSMGSLSDLLQNNDEDEESKNKTAKSTTGGDMKENKTVKISKKYLIELIGKILSEQSTKQKDVEESNCSGTHKREDKLKIKEEETEELQEKKKCCGRDNCKHPRDDKFIKEIEEIEEKRFAGDSNLDPDGDGAPYWADDDEEKPKNESKIQTPEQENTLYERRFTPKNNRLFEKLVKQWTK